MASRFRLRRLRDVPRFFADSMRIHRQTSASPGALGVSLIARPLRREFFTLSAWTSREDLNQMVRTEPHRSAMRRHRAGMADATFTFWDVDYDNLPVSWDEARTRLDAATAAHD
jgi:heme-degrading monooxygenase HmoA